MEPRRVNGPELRIAPIDMARDIARRKGWPTIEPLRVEPVQAPQRQSEPVVTRDARAQTDGDTRAPQQQWDFLDGTTPFLAIAPEAQHPPDILTRDDACLTHQRKVNELMNRVSTDCRHLTEEASRLFDLSPTSVFLALLEFSHRLQWLYFTRSLEEINRAIHALGHLEAALSDPKGHRDLQRALLVASAASVLDFPALLEDAYYLDNKLLYVKRFIRNRKQTDEGWDAVADFLTNEATRLSEYETNRLVNALRRAALNLHTYSPHERIKTLEKINTALGRLGSPSVEGDFRKQLEKQTKAEKITHELEWSVSSLSSCDPEMRASMLDRIQSSLIELYKLDPKLICVDRVDTEDYPITIRRYHIDVQGREVQDTKLVFVLKVDEIPTGILPRD